MPAIRKKFGGKSTGKKTAGRPRSEQARAAILRAASRLLYKAAVRDITTNQIAADAGVSTATLYRWWPTKEAILLDAYITRLEGSLTESAGTPLQKLAAHLLQIGQAFQGKEARVTLRLLMAIQEDGALRKSFFERLCQPQMIITSGWLQEAIEGGELPAETDHWLFVDSICGVLLSRLLIGHAPIHDGVIQDAFDLAVAGAKCVKKSGLR